ncbi:MAG: hypothetical protein HQL83_16845 [Magnetococcales bacterium]|nr:hypothetical protein [Magnetococcales bacterium]
MLASEKEWVWVLVLASEKEWVWVLVWVLVLVSAPDTVVDDEDELPLPPPPPPPHPEAVIHSGATSATMAVAFNMRVIVLSPFEGCMKYLIATTS